MELKNSLKEDREDNEEMVAFSRIYTKVSSLEFKLILGGIILGIALLIFLLTKDIGKVIKDMGISLVVGAIIFGTLVLIRDKDIDIKDMIEKKLKIQTGRSVFWITEK